MNRPRMPMFVALTPHSRQRGAGKFEFAVVAIIFAVLSGVLLQKMYFYQHEAEKLAIDRVLMILRAALADKASSLYLKGKAEDFRALERENPMRWLERPPPNYAGEFDAPKDGAVPAGSWYFDRSTTTLSYVLNNRDYFGEERSKRLNFKVRFARNQQILSNNHEGPGLGIATLEEVKN